MKSLEPALEHLPEIQQRVRKKRVAVFLDYDGTLTPIVARPELAVLSEEMRRSIVQLSRRCIVAIISGRARPDVEKMVQIEGLYYAGSHGFDIKGPDLALVPPEVRPILPKIADAYEELRSATRDISGCLVENKTYALAVHFRLCDPTVVPKLEALVDAIVAKEPTLRKTGGKMIFEIRANLPWDKGRALDYFLSALHLSGAEVLPFYFGDDETDEDAFRAIATKGIGILVGESAQDSAASYRLRDVAEVQRFLDLLATWLT